jgi:hypothetical protein
MSFEPVSALGSSAFDRNKARELLVLYQGARPAHGFNDLLDALEACVVMDPRITRIEVLLADGPNGYDWPAAGLYQLRKILRGDSE